MERIVVEMAWEVPNKCTYTQRVQLRDMIDTFMNEVAEKLAWDEETFSIESKTKKER